MKSGEQDSCFFSSQKGLVESFASPKVQPIKTIRLTRKPDIIYKNERIYKWCFDPSKTL